LPEFVADVASAAPDGLGQNERMSVQHVTSDLRQWILAQTSAGHAPDVIVKSMLASGWTEAVALQALEDTLRSHLVERAAAAADAGLPPSVRVPEPAALEGITCLDLSERQVSILASLREPRVMVFGGLLSDTECDELVALAKTRLARSETVQVHTGASEVNTARTSEGMFFGRGENPLCARIEARIAELLNWPLENGEGLQILRYGPGAEYKPHYDYFDPVQPGTPAILRRGGQRVASLVIYLAAPGRGGATVFPDLNLEVNPVKGNAVFFSYDRPHPATRTLHGGAPVIEGEKWVATKWLREGRFE
jgi:prolyl 4-hydroxylase